MFEDGWGGLFGDWSSDLTRSWRAECQRPMTDVERATYDRNVAVTRARVKVERDTRQAEAAVEAARIWATATPILENEGHDYLTIKGIQAHGMRLHGSDLVIPMYEGDMLHSLQFIKPFGEKRFLAGGRVTGCYVIIGNVAGATTLCIAEGYATGASLHEASGHPVTIAFSADNLGPVARAMRKQLPGARVILCADDDVGCERNVGVAKATEAARSIGGLLAVPIFDESRPQGAKDFNDLAKCCGDQALRQAIARATDLSRIDPGAPPPDAAWPECQPLTASIDPSPYPLDALPQTIRAAVQEVLTFTKAPVSLVSLSALAPVSLAAQAYADAKRAEMLCGPVSLYLMVVADSGERKSTCDRFFTQSIRDYDERQVEAAKDAVKNYRAEIEAWEAKSNGIKERIRTLTKSMKSTEAMEVALRDLEFSKPTAPRVPRLLHTDATPEALAYALASSWPAGGVVSAEAGMVFGAHGMSKDSIMRNLALLNVLWDGSSFSVERRSSESFAVRGVRLTVALQVQEATLQNFFDRSGGLARGTGFLARFLIAWPTSTQGSRPFTEAPANWPALAEFNRRIAKILESRAPVGEDGALNPPFLSLSPEAKARWICFHDRIESQLSSGGELADISDVASKTADNAVRLAALFQIFEEGVGTISETVFNAASRIAEWHLNEAKRFFGALALPTDMGNAEQLDRWLINHCRTHQTNFVCRRIVQRYITPARLRQKANLDAALAELAEAGRAMMFFGDRAKSIYVNPLLLQMSGG
jgi:putative DNA primase/helicase